MTVHIVAALRYHSEPKARPNYEFLINHSVPDIASLLGQISAPSPQRQNRNPIYMAQEWHRSILEGNYTCSADLARHLGVSRARVTQVLRLLKLAPETLEIIGNLGDPLLSVKITERKLRTIVNLSLEEQMRELSQILR